ncbi:hypothetical protein [Terasakiella pusilla]|uniref:hypothetical protein n=1 Tax=Terasakiella pusilla TaxID=64973 RepID=UPI0012EC7B6A|nr:hypothetical protein [Terasakiella pusilla]
MKKYLLTGLFLGISLFSFNPTNAADSTSYTAVDVPWEEPTARRARTSDYATSAGNGVRTGSGSTLTLSNGQTVTLSGGSSTAPSYRNCSNPTTGHGGTRQRPFGCGYYSDICSNGSWRQTGYYYGPGCN